MMIAEIVFLNKNHAYNEPDIRAGCKLVSEVFSEFWDSVMFESAFVVFIVPQSMSEA